MTGIGEAAGTLVVKLTPEFCLKVSAILYVNEFPGVTRKIQGTHRACLWQVQRDLEEMEAQ